MEHEPSNCVVHDDTFDWGGPSDIIAADESNNNSSHGSPTNFSHSRS